MNKKPKGWYKELVLRPVMHIEGYESYEKICGHVAEFYFAVDEQYLKGQLRTNVTESRNITLYTLFKVGEAKCPAYWVNKDLLEALMQSNLDVEAESLNWAMKTGIFMLPKGAVMSPENHNIDAIYWYYDTANKLLYWTATDGVSFFCRRVKVDGNLANKYADVDDLDPAVVTQFNDYLQAIFLRLILIMECRTDLVDVETQSQKVTVNKGFSKDKAVDFYQPLMLGRTYHAKKEDGQSSSSSGTHGSSKSVHWRRGFFRNQPYGEGRQQRKIVWIEPVLVMGGE